MNTELIPVSWYEYKRTIFPKVCANTGERIGWFTKAHRRTTEVEYRGEVYTNTVEWFSPAGHMLNVLTGKTGTYGD